MIFTLNGGPGDGQKVEVGGKHTDGRTVRFVWSDAGEKSVVYVCPSEDDFLERQLYLTHLDAGTPFPLESTKWTKEQISRVWGKEVADWATNPNSGEWNDWRTAVKKPAKVSKAAALAAEKKYKKRDTVSHEQGEHIPVRKKPSSESDDIRFGRYFGPYNGSERNPQSGSQWVQGDGSAGSGQSGYPR